LFIHQNCQGFLASERVFLAQKKISNELDPLPGTSRVFASLTLPHSPTSISKHELSLVSLTFQKHSLAPSDVISTIGKLYLVVGTLYTSNGAALQHFLDEFDPVTSAYRGINLEDADGGMVLFQKDRKEILDSLLA
jgi:hypothetical protein